MDAKYCIKAAMYVTQKNLPKLLSIAGSIGSVASTVWACKRTLNMPDILAENDKELDAIEKIDTDPKTKLKMKRRLLIKTTGKICKNYAGPAAGVIVSTAANAYGMHVEHERTVEAATVAAGAIQTLRGYRDRVKERYGDDVEKELYYNMKKGEVEETVTDEKGKEKKVKKKVNVVDPDATNDFRRYLTRHNQKWWNGGDRLYVEHNIDMANDILTRKLQADDFGTLTINEVYEYLGFEKCREGMTYGWIFDYNNPDLQNVVNITFEEVYIPGDRGELEKAYALDFNIDGNIYEMTAGKKDSK